MFFKLIIFAGVLLVAYFPNVHAQDSNALTPGSFYSELTDGLTPEQKAKIEEIGNNADATREEALDAIKKEFDSWGISDKFNKVEESFKSFIEDLKNKASESPFIQKFLSVIEDGSLKEGDREKEIQSALESADKSDVEILKDSLSKNFQDIKGKISQWFEENE